MTPAPDPHARLRDELDATATRERLVNLLCYLEALAHCLHEDPRFVPDADDLAAEIAETKAVLGQAVPSPSHAPPPSPIAPAGPETP